MRSVNEQLLSAVALAELAEGVAPTELTKTTVAEAATTSAVIAATLPFLTDPPSQHGAWGCRHTDPFTNRTQGRARPRARAKGGSEAARANGGVASSRVPGTVPGTGCRWLGRDDGGPGELVAHPAPFDA